MRYDSMAWRWSCGILRCHGLGLIANAGHNRILAVRNFRLFVALHVPCYFSMYRSTTKVQRFAENQRLLMASYLSKYVKCTEIICRIVESQVPVQARDSIKLTFIQIKSGNLQVLLQTLRVVTLWNNGQTSLSSPSQKYLRGRLVMLLRNSRNLWVFKQHRGILGLLPLKFDKRLRTE